MNGKSPIRVPLLLGFLLSLGATAAMAQASPPFVARTEPLNPTYGGCDHAGPVQIAMRADYTGVIDWYQQALSTSTVGFDATGHAGLPHSGNYSRRTDISALPGERFMVVVHQGGYNALSTRIYNPPEWPAWHDFAVGSLPAIDAADNAESVIAWAGAEPIVPSILVGLFDAAGHLRGEPRSVAALEGTAAAVDVTRAADGSFVVYWEDLLASGAGSKLWLRRFDAAGTPLAAAELVAAQAPFAGPFYSGAFRAADGAAAVVYSDAVTGSIRARVIEGGVLGPAFVVWQQADDPAKRAQAAFLADGDLAIAAEIQLGGGAASIQLLRFGRDGQPIGSRVEVARPGLPYRSFADPHVAAAGDRVGVAYEVRDNGDPCQIRFRLFDATLFADGFESGGVAAWSGGI